MNITYIHHSCFVVELNSCTLVFDYYQGDLPIFDKQKPLYVFASHVHDDHFHERIFLLRASYPNCTFILSSDITGYEHRDVCYVEANKEYTIDQLCITTYKSTDEGVAFLVHSDDRFIYHAGDLHWWHWEDENTKAENEDAKNLYLAEIDKLKGIAIDVAFLPVDPRLEKQFYYGACAFFERCSVKTVFPMHMWGRYDVITALKKLAIMEPYAQKIQTISTINQVFLNIE